MRPAVALVGRINVGKSTLFNRLTRSRAALVADFPGLTRDRQYGDGHVGPKPFLVIDSGGFDPDSGPTPRPAGHEQAEAAGAESDGVRFLVAGGAGVRAADQRSRERLRARRGRVFEAVEKFSVIKTLQAVEQCNVVTLLLDASTEIAEQDAHIAGYILERGRALVMAVNKWDGVREEQRERIKREMRRKLHFLDWASLHFISALRGTGLQGLMRSVVAAEQAAFSRLPTPKLTRALRAAVERQEPPRAGNVRPKLRYAHQGGSNPPIVVIHGNSLQHVPDTYRRYLEGWFREQFALQGTPLRIEFRSGATPFAPQRTGKRRAFQVD